MSVLALAEKWGVPPWEIADHPESLDWLFKADAVAEARAALDKPHRTDTNKDDGWTKL